MSFHINIAKILGLLLIALIISAIVVDVDQHKKDNNDWKKSEKILTTVLVVWAIGISLDVVFGSGYTYTFVKGLSVGT